jgi:hypothetical protein
MTSQFEHKRRPVVGLPETLSEKAFAAERAIAGLRQFVIVANTIIYTAFTDKSGTITSLAYAVIALSPVYGLDVYLAPRYSGFGLGLWIVQQIVGELGGRIELLSQPGEGSTFVVELPLSAAPSSTEEPASAEPTQLRGRLG